MPRLALLIIGLLVGCTSTSRGLASVGTARAADAEALDVIQTAEALFAAMEARDTLSIRRLFLPGAELIIVRPQPDADPLVDRRRISDFITSVAAAPEPLRERMWDPQVEVKGPLATLWAPYDFHLGDRFSHCGIDAFHLVQTSSGWKIAGLTYTVETTSCPVPPALPN